MFSEHHPPRSIDPYPEDPQQAVIQMPASLLPRKRSGVQRPALKIAIGMMATAVTSPRAATASFPWTLALVSPRP